MITLDRFHHQQFCLESSDWSRFSVNPRGYAGDPIKMQRRDSGRIDAIMNDTECAMALLKKERELFEKLYITNRDIIEVLDMSHSCETIAEDMSVLLSET